MSDETGNDVVRAAEVLPARRGVTEDDFMPLMTVTKLLKRKEVLSQVIKEILVEGVDYGVLPGTGKDGDKEKVLKKPGAEKLCNAFGLAPKIVKLEKVEDWTGKDHDGEPFFNYEYTVALWRGDVFLGEASGSCNSWEAKYRYRWLPEAEVVTRPDFAKLPKRGGKRKEFQFDFSLERQETTGRYGKPAEYWAKFRALVEAKKATRVQRETKNGMRQGWEIEIDDTFYRIPNPNSADVVNTCQKIGFKRALVAVVLIVTNCSDGFTQDLEEDPQPATVVVPEGPAGPEPPPPDEEKREPAGPAPPAEPVQQTLDVPTTAIPEEMRLLVERVRKDPRNQLRPAYDLLLDQFKKRAGQTGMHAFDKVNADFRQRFPRGGPPQSIEDHVNNLIDLYDELQKFPEPAPAEAASV